MHDIRRCLGRFAHWCAGMMGGKQAHGISSDLMRGIGIGLTIALLLAVRPPDGSLH